MSNPPSASAAGSGTAATAAGHHVNKLPTFWSASPSAWFRVIEGQFALHGVTDPIERYYLVINALSETNVDLVHKIVEAEATADSFKQIRDALVATHTLSAY
jgi:hypothetical protein